jgi:hypothetical protein
VRRVRKSTQAEIDALNARGYQTRIIITNRKYDDADQPLKPHETDQFAAASRDLRRRRVTFAASPRK